MRQRLFTYPFFLFLLPVFFVLHGYMDHYDIIPLADAGILLLVYLFASLLLGLVCWLVFRNFQKAFLFAFLLMAYFFFFGAMQDFLKNISANGFISRYSFILPLSLILFIAAFIFIKRSKKYPGKTTGFLNVVLLILILLDFALLVNKMLSPRPTVVLDSNLKPCPSCPKPDIYLIVADGYPGSIELKDLMQFDNSAFENELRKRGFHIVDSSNSNYNFSPFSVASMLNMNYLQGLNGSNTDKKDIRISYETIKKSNVLRYMQQEGYELYNYSIFDFERQPSLTKPSFLTRGTTPITSQTLLHRLDKQLGHLLITKFKIGFFSKKILYTDLRNNTKLFKLTEEIAVTKTAAPKFVYTHIVMPHYPYYFDREGNRIPQEKLTDEWILNPAAFTDYLLYANKKYLALVDHIQRSSARPPIIILISDHGLREFNRPVDPKYFYMNLNAVSLPDSNYQGFYKGMTGVNQFRAVLNSQFGQQLPMIKDSTSFLRE